MDRPPPSFARAEDSPVTGAEVDGRLVSLTAPASVAAEQYRTLFYRLERMRTLRPMKVTAFTSAMPGEGKTVTTVNLALTAARANPDRRILLIDADLRRSQVAELLGIRSRPGLSELLQGDCEPGEAIRRFMSTRLAVIPAGAVPEEVTQLLASDAMRQVLAHVRESFDEVYIDLPPTLPFVDAAVLGTQTDAVVMVIRANKTSIEQVNEAIEQLAGAPIVGSVLNGADIQATPYLKSYLRKELGK